ncbi:hypothetical protein [Roseovarius sp. SYSU LYC5161]|uniref:hypothetical protein n=1 Tax=Roseovarius halophilus (ex Wu et al. 2025) TaxID=3376060 RepID=UPI003999F6D5
MRVTVSVLVIAAASGCAPSIPDSASGVGFGDYDTYQQDKERRDAQLSGSAVPAPGAVSEQPLDAVGLSEPAITPEQDDIGAATRAVLDATTENSADAAGARTPGSGDTDDAEPDTVLTPEGISQENDFEAVGAERSIEDDAELIAQNRAQYKVIEPSELPERRDSDRPNIVAYALETVHPPGTRLFERFGFNKEARYNRNCVKYASPDRAQEDFMARGGPQRDRLGLDPDGDGYACGWDPRPFRRAMQGQDQAQDQAQDDT